MLLVLLSHDVMDASAFFTSLLSFSLIFPLCFLHELLKQRLSMLFLFYGWLKL